MNTDRDIHFRGFAKLLLKELKGHIINICDARAEGIPPDMDYAQVEQLLARCAYDLANHILSHTDFMTWDAYRQSPMELIAEEYTIPDMTTLPEKGD